MALSTLFFGILPWVSQHPETESLFTAARLDSAIVAAASQRSDYARNGILTAHPTDQNQTARIGANGCLSGRWALLFGETNYVFFRLFTDCVDRIVLAGGVYLQTLRSGVRRTGRMTRWVRGMPWDGSSKREGRLP